MKKLLLAPFLLVLLFSSSVIWFYLMAQPVMGNKTFSNFLIPKGSSASQIGNKLQKAGLIRSALVFKIYIQFTGQAAGIQAGEFRLSPSFSLFQTVTQLRRGPLEIWVTIPEGLRREEIAAKFAAGLEKPASFTTDFLELTKNSEGMLFPDTYLFPKEASASSIVKKMLSTFGNKTSSLNLTKDQIILASLVERETKGADERPVVAGIMIKRIQAGWPLQVDASVQYAVASSKCKITDTKCNWWQPLTKEDIAINSLYNTYKYPGLPPGPIANPGLSSIKAAYNPVATDYWYYIHDNQGQIHYAKTLEEHNQNILKYLGK